MSVSSSAHASAPSTSTAATVDSGRANRDAFFDNAKFFAILLVVVGHAVNEMRPDSRLVSAAYLWVYTFHMPAFIVIAGYFSKSFDPTRRRVQRLVAGCVVPYLAFEIIYTILQKRLDHGGVPWSLQDPVWLDWFLLALFIWRLSSPLWRWIRWPLAVSVLLALAWNFTAPGELFGMTRVVELLPFFVLGTVLRREHFDYLRRWWIRALAIVTLAGSGVAILCVRPNFSGEWVYWRHTVAELNAPYSQGLALRMGMLVVSTALVLSFLALVPRSRAWYTALGSGTIYAYLLHGVLVRAVELLHLYDHVGDDRTTLYAWVVITVLAATLCGIALMTPPVKRATRWLIEPRLDWFFRAAPEPTGS